MNNKQKNFAKAKLFSSVGKYSILSTQTKNIISVILPLVTIFLIAFTLRMQPTGLVVYENKTLYRLNGSININLEEKIPADAYIRVKADDNLLGINLIEFLDKSGKKYEIVKSDGKKYIIGEGAYSLDFNALGITWGFEKGKHVIKTEIVYEDKVLYENEETINV